MRQDLYVLLIDASEERRVHLATFLRQKDFVVVAVVGVTQALSRLQSFHFDVLIADVTTCGEMLPTLQTAARTVNTRLFLAADDERLELTDVRDAKIKKPASPSAVFNVLDRRSGQR